jgi:predicted metal-dependent hydrolase
MTDLEVHHDGYPIHRRKARFGWSNAPLHWVPGDPFSTHMLSVLHLLLPASERWLIQAINHPGAEASTQLAMDYLEQSPAARAARKRAEAQLTGSEGCPRRSMQQGSDDPGQIAQPRHL